MRNEDHFDLRVLALGRGSSTRVRKGAFYRSHVGPETIRPREARPRCVEKARYGLMAIARRTTPSTSSHRRSLGGRMISHSTQAPL